MSCDDLIKRLSSSAGGRFSSFVLQNVATKAYVEDESISREINDLLKPFAEFEPRNDYQIEAHVVLCDTVPAGMIPPKTAEMLENAGDVLRYYVDGDIRYIEAPSVGWAIADIKKSKIVVAALRGPQIKTWHVAHHLFYPLWVQLMKMHSIFALHAAGLVKDGVGIIFPAYSGTGKSVLSLRMVRDGWRLLSDDTIFLQETDGRIMALGYPERINLRTDALSLFTDVPIIDPRESSGWKACVDVESLSPGCFIDKATPEAVVLITRSDRIESKVEAVSKAEALTKLFRYTLFFTDPSASKQNFGITSKLVEQSQCFHLDIGKDLTSLLSAINEIVRKVKA
jgi:hypothetical protein